MQLLLLLLLPGRCCCCLVAAVAAWSLLLLLLFAMTLRKQNQRVETDEEAVPNPPTLPYTPVPGTATAHLPPPAQSLDSLPPSSRHKNFGFVNTKKTLPATGFDPVTSEL